MKRVRDRAVGNAGGRLDLSHPQRPSPAEPRVEQHLHDLEERRSHARAALLPGRLDPLQCLPERGPECLKLGSVGPGRKGPRLNPDQRQALPHLGFEEPLDDLGPLLERLLGGHAAADEDETPPIDLAVSLHGLRELKEGGMEVADRAGLTHDVHDHAAVSASEVVRAPCGRDDESSGGRKCRRLDFHCHQGNRPDSSTQL